MKKTMKIAAIVAITPEQLRQVEDTVEADIKEKIKNELVLQLKEQIKAEIIHDSQSPASHAGSGNN